MEETARLRGFFDFDAAGLDGWTGEKGTFNSALYV